MLVQSMPLLCHLLNPCPRSCLPLNPCCSVLCLFVAGHSNFWSCRAAVPFPAGQASAASQVQTYHEKRGTSTIEMWFAQMSARSALVRYTHGMTSCEVLSCIFSCLTYDKSNNMRRWKTAQMGSTKHVSV